MRTPRLAFALLAAAASVAGAPALAQYKWIGPDGSVTYSDLPPPPGITGIAMGVPVPSRDDDALPAPLRGPVARYPVVLYTTPDCTPCQQARAHLTRRGVPFSERTVGTSADADAFRRAGFRDNAFPSVSVGRERGTGFEAGEWDRLLDAAGYPRASVLPPSYKPPPARAAAAGDRRDDDAAGAVAPDALAAAPAAADAAKDGPPPARQRGPAPRPAVPPPPPRRDASAVRF